MSPGPYRCIKEAARAFIGLGSPAIRAGSLPTTRARKAAHWGRLSSAWKYVSRLRSLRISRLRSWSKKGTLAQPRDADVNAIGIATEGWLPFARYLTSQEAVAPK